MRTTKKELMEMLGKVSDNAQIVLKVRVDSTTDYSEQRIVAFENNNGVLIIKDKLSE
jgi:hypothetical protein